MSLYDKKFQPHHTRTKHLTINIRNFVLVVSILLPLSHGGLLLGTGRPLEQLLLYFAVQDLHEAVRVGVVVYRAALGTVPTQDHQVEFVVAAIHQVPCISVK